MAGRIFAIQFPFTDRLKHNLQNTLKKLSRFPDLFGKVFSINLKFP